MPGVPGAADRAQFLNATESVVDDAFAGTINELVMVNALMPHTLRINRSLTASTSIDATNAYFIIEDGQVLSSHLTTLTQVNIDGSGTVVVTGTQPDPGLMTMTNSAVVGMSFLPTVAVDTYASLNLGEGNMFSGRLVNAGQTTVSATTTAFAGATITNSGTLDLLVTLSFQSSLINNSANGLIKHTFDQTLENSQITNHGTWQWDGGRLELRNGTVFDNRGTFDIRCDQTMATGGETAGRFDNHGVFKKTVGGGGAATTLTLLDFNNQTLEGGPTASVEVWAGRMRMANGGDVTGTFTAGANGMLDLISGVWTLKSDSAFLGAGTTRITQATVQGEPAGGILLTSNCILEVWEGAAVKGELVNVMLASNGTLRLMGGRLGSVNAQVATLEIAGLIEQHIENSTLTLNGTTTWDQSNDIRLKTSTIRNRGTFNILNDQTIIEDDPDLPSRIINEAGTVKKSGGA